MCSAAATSRRLKKLPAALPRAATTPTRSSAASVCGTRRRATRNGQQACDDGTGRRERAGRGTRSQAHHARASATAAPRASCSRAIRRRGERLSARGGRHLSRLLEEPHHRRDAAAARAASPRNPACATRIDAMFRGEKINITENRAVLHVALRAPQRRVDHRRRQERRARGPRGARQDGATSRIACAAARGRATPASASATSSTSASAAPTSGR